MQVRISTGSAALAVANTHADADELAPLTVEGALLALDFGEDATPLSISESVATMDTYLAGLIADADEPADISALSALKRAVLEAGRNAVRESSYTKIASADSEATAPDAESQLHADSHTDINGSSISDGADEETETQEVSDYGTQEEQGSDGSADERKPRRRR